MTKRKSDLVVIKSVHGELTAQIVKTHLESEGIPVLLQYESLGRIYGFMAGGLEEVKLLVPQEFAGEARQILKRDASSESA